MDNPLNIDSLVHSTQEELLAHSLDRIEMHGVASVGELAAQARAHYEEISQKACWYNSVVPTAIKSWEREPRVLEMLKALHAPATSVFPCPFPQCGVCRLILEIQADWPQHADERRW